LLATGCKTIFLKQRSTADCAERVTYYFNISTGHAAVLEIRK